MSAAASRVAADMGWASVLLLLASVAGASPAVPPALSPAIALRSDPPPAKITNDTHYLVSNERRLDLFADDVRDRGQVYVGVGAGQNYVLAGWADPDFMVLIDFDADVVDLHALYISFFAHAPDILTFEALWVEEAAARRLLALAQPLPLRRARLEALYLRARAEVASQLVRMRSKLEEAGETGYLNDAEQYRRIAALARRGRIVAKRGDFTAPGVVADLADVLRSTDSRIGVLYLSNIEQYFMYGPGFRKNVAALPLDAETAVLRTLPARPAGFEYLVQTGADAQAWITLRSTRSVYRMRGPIHGVERPASTRVELLPPPR